MSAAVPTQSPRQAAGGVGGVGAEGLVGLQGFLEGGRKKAKMGGDKTDSVCTTTWPLPHIPAQASFRPRGLLLQPWGLLTRAFILDLRPN